MIGFVLGTAEGREILEEVNKFTDDIVVSTATNYGGKILSNYKMKHLNTTPLDEVGFSRLIKRFDIKLMVDASHPYAKNVSLTLIKVCEKLKVTYVRYERMGYLDNFINDSRLTRIFEYGELVQVLKNIKGNVLNTTGSNNISEIEELKLSNRVIHRVLPEVNVMEKLKKMEISIENVIAIKGPFSKEINSAIIKDYHIEAMITKDGGIEGGTKEKVEAAFENNIKIILIDKPRINYEIKFNHISEMIKFIKKFKEWEDS